MNSGTVDNENFAFEQRYHSSIVTARGRRLSIQRVTLRLNSAAE
jgi:hypothetical protein